MDNEQIKHLEFIQNIITRMAHCSFMIKGWCVMILSALFALYAEIGNEKLLVCGIVPILAFWGLDGYFLRQERMYRELYELARKGEVCLFVLNPCIEPMGYMNKKNLRMINVFLSQSLLMLYVPLLLLIIVIYLVGLFV